MSNTRTVECRVEKIKSTRWGTSVKFKNLTVDRKLGIFSDTFSILFPENPGWNEGDKIQLPATKKGPAQ